MSISASGLPPRVVLSVPDVPGARRWPVFFGHILLRFATLYFTLSFLSGTLPMGLVIQPVAEAVWGIKEFVPNTPSGSGDRLYDWLAAFSLLIVSAVGTALWTGVAPLSRRLLSKENVGDGSLLREYLRVLLRYTLAMMIMNYGFAKTMQFPSLSMATLAQPIGENTPMGLLWNFMGYSASYSLFSGALEILGGFLLLFRRTTTVGALLFTAVMLNIFVLNLCYDIPVKLASFHYLVEGMILLIPDVSRLLDVFLLNRPTMPRRLTPPIRYRRLRTVVLGIKWIGVTLLIGANANQSWSGWKEAQAPRDPMDGAWTVDSFVPKPKGAFGSWRSLEIVDREWGAFATLHSVEGKTATCRLTGKTSDPRTLIFQTTVMRGRTFVGNATSSRQEWTSRQPTPDTLILTGTLDGAATTIRLRRDEERYLLARQHFHWIQEYPRTP